MTSEKIEILSLNISREKGTIKKPVKEVKIDRLGMVGDAHSGKWHRQITLLSKELIDEFCNKHGINVEYGEFAENMTTKGLDLREVCILDRFQIGKVELEVTQIGKKCHDDDCAVFQRVGKCLMPKEGIFCRVKKGGKIKVGDEMEYIREPLQIIIITVSNRASSGAYKDVSGTEIKKIIEKFFQGKRWHLEIKNILIPDDESLIRKNIEAECFRGADIIVTTGGTGIGPGDMTPDVVAPMCDKIIPGIMEHIRIKYGENNPNALLSRGVAGVMEKTLIYTLPGSVRAVREYMEEILKTLEHLIFMINEIDTH